MSHVKNSWICSIELLSKSGISFLRWLYTPCCQCCDWEMSWIVCARNLLAAWTTYVREVKVTFGWKKCRGSETKSKRPDERGSKQKQRKGQLTQVGQAANTRQASASSEETKVRVSHTIDNKSSHYSRKSLPRKDTHIITPYTSSQTWVGQNQTLQVPSQSWPQY